MVMNKSKNAVGASLTLVIVCMGVGLLTQWALAELPKVSPDVSGQAQAIPPASEAWASRLLAEKFAAIQKLIKPHAGESRWMEIPWQTSLWEARRLAAAAGKPIFIWFGSGGAPLCHT